MNVMTKKIETTHLEAWRLFLTTHARLVEAIDRSLSSAEQIPLNWYDVLIELYEAPDRRLRMHELAARVVLSRSGLTRLVDRLEHAGLLRREPDPQDRRGFYTIITPEGIEAMRRAWPVYAEGILKGFAQHLSEEEARVLVRAFSAMLASLREDK